MTTFEQLRALLINFGVPEELIFEKAPLVQLGFDSLDRVAFLVEIEQGFEVEIPGDDFEKWVTLADATEYLEKVKVAA